MEQQRIARIEKRKAGGSAGKSSLKYSVSLPSPWVKELHLTDGRIELSRSEDGKIIIQKRMPYEINEFLQEARQAGHKVRVYKYYDGETLCSTVAADFSAEQVAVQNESTDIIKTAFGVNRHPTWVDFLTFLEDRCVPRTRANVGKYLSALNLMEYDPVQLIEKTQGRMMEDNQWIEVV